MDVVAPMPANVFEVMVNVGDAVTEEQELMLLESMKMEVPVESPVNGTVSAVKVAKGDAVAEGDVLLVIDPS